MITRNERFTIKNSKIVQGGYFIKDEEKTYAFPTTADGSDLFSYSKALNELSWSKQLVETQILHVIEDRDYYKTKCGSLEEELFMKERQVHKMHKKNERFESMLNDFIRTERTEIGKSVLRQLKEALEL